MQKISCTLIYKNNAKFRYYVLTSIDLPPVKVFLVEKSHPPGPFGAKGMGEIASTPLAPAIANAVYDACGVRIRDLPIKPDKVLKNLHNKSWD